MTANDNPQRSLPYELIHLSVRSFFRPYLEKQMHLKKRNCLKGGWCYCV